MAAVACTPPVYSPYPPLPPSPTPNPSSLFLYAQIAFEHTELDYDVMVNMRLYFSYMTVNHDLYAMRAAAPPTCWLGETCHRACGSDEHQLDVVLGDTVGDGWNAGSLGLYNHFYFGSRASTMSVTEGARTGSSVTTAEVRVNTLPTEVREGGRGGGQDCTLCTASWHSYTQTRHLLELSAP